MVFYRFDGYFGCVDAMVVWFYQLDFCSVGLDVGFDGAGAFVIKDMECWLVAVSRF